MRILVVVSGSTKRHKKFEEVGKKLGIEVVVASLSGISYLIENSEIEVFVKNQKVEDFNLVYFRLIGSSKEQMSVLLEYARENKIRVVDGIYEHSKYLEIPLKKSVENQILVKNGIRIPNTYFGSPRKILSKAPHVVGFPMVVKSTSGRRGRDVWLVEDHDQLEKLVRKIKTIKASFLAQEMLDGSYRTRVLIVGGKAIGAISRPTLLARRTGITKLEISGIKQMESEQLIERFGAIATKAARALHLDIAGVDIVTNKGRPYVIEVNQSPRWESIVKELKVSPEEEIIKFLKKVAKRPLVHY